MSWWTSELCCKDCGKKFRLPRTARERDIARGLSEPERCRRCRDVNAKTIRSLGAAYWAAPRETDDSKRCWGKYGLARLVRERVEPIWIEDRGIDPQLPLRYLHDPASITDPADRVIAEKFSRLAPAVEELVKNLEDPAGTRVSVLVGPTGTGKSTWAPYRILRSRVGELGRICVTQPRTITLRKPRDRQADQTIPGYIARHLVREVMPDGTPGVGPGHAIGYRYRDEYEQYDRYTKLLFVTDGTLIHWLKSGEVGQFDVVMIDEAHEQSRNMELIFALLKHRMALYPRLRLVIASATADVARLRSYFGDGDERSVFLAAPDLAEGQTPCVIHDNWLEDFAPQIPGFPQLESCGEASERMKLLPGAVAAVVKAIATQPGFTRLGEPRGDILVFVPTIASIKKCCEAVEHLGLRLDVLPCHAQMERDALARYRKAERAAEEAFRRGMPTNPQRVIIATNYAETSVTISNLRYVIDSGLIMQPRFDSPSCSDIHETRWHSRAGCTQRKGRVGRALDGECFRLYTHAEHGGFEEHTAPELARTSLDMFLLSAKAAGIEDLRSFQWLGRSHGSDEEKGNVEREFRRSMTALRTHGTLDAEWDVTNRGVELDRMQVPTVDLAYCLSESDRYACTLEMASYLAFLGQKRGSFANKQGLVDEQGLVAYARWREGCHDDLEFCLRLLHAWLSHGKQAAKWAKTEAISPDFMGHVLRQRDSYLRIFEQRSHTSVTQRALDLDRLHRVRLLLAASLSEWAYVRSDVPGEFRPFGADCPSALPIRIDRESACYAATDLEAFVCVERLRHRKDLLARNVVCVMPEWLEQAKGLGPIGRAMLLHRTLRGPDHDRGRRSSLAVVQAPETLPVDEYQVGQRIKLRAIRTLSKSDTAEDGPRRRVLVAVHGSKQASILVSVASSDIEPGRTFEAHICKIDRDRNLLFADQTAIVAEIDKRSAEGIDGRVIELYRDESGSLLKARIELVAGISGYLRRSHVHWAGISWFEQLQESQNARVSVHRVRENGSIDLATPEVRANRDRGFRPGERLESIIETRLPEGRDGIVQLEIAPGRRGFLKAKDIPIQWPADQWQVGQSLPVVVVGFGTRGHPRVVPEVVWEARHRTYQSGEAFSGVVASFATRDDRCVGVFVEFQPGVQGYLPRGLRSMPVQHHLDMDRWEIRDTLDIVVDRVDESGKIRLCMREVHQARKHRFAVGQTMQGTIASYDQGHDGGPGPVAAHLELKPGRHGYLRYRDLGPLSWEVFSTLRVGDQFDVVISRIDGSQIDLKPWSQPAKPGQTLDGIVTGFLLGDDGMTRIGAFVEIRPGQKGLLHHSHAPATVLTGLGEGDRLAVVVQGVSVDGKGTTRFELHWSDKKPVIATPCKDKKKSQNASAQSTDVTSNKNKSKKKNKKKKKK